MQRDWLLGFPPVLLAQDDQMPCSDEGLHFPLGIPEQAYTEYKSRPEYKRTRELMAFEMIKARPEITEADCRQAKPKTLTASIDTTFTAASETLTIELGSGGVWVIKDEASPVTAPQPSPPGVWRKTAEHKPPVGSEHLTRYTGRGCEKSPDVRPLVWDGRHWGEHNIGSEVLRDWLDTSGEFKVGDRVRIGVSEHGAPARLCGAIGRVVQKIDDDFGVRVGGESRAWWYGPNELEHA